MSDFYADNRSSTNRRFWIALLCAPALSLLVITLIATMVNAAFFPDARDENLLTWVGVPCGILLGLFVGLFNHGSVLTALLVGMLTVVLYCVLQLPGGGEINWPLLLRFALIVPAFLLGGIIAWRRSNRRYSSDSNW